MQTGIQVVLNENNETSPEKIQEIIREIDDLEQDIDVELQEPKQLLPTLGVGESLTLVIAVNSTINLLINTYPAIRNRFSNIGGETTIPNTDKIAKGYLVNQAGISQEEISLNQRDVSGNVIEFVYIDQETDKEYYVKVNKNEIENLEYEER